MIGVEVLTPGEWASLSEKAHVICFNEKRYSYMDRIDFTLLGVIDSEPVAYCTVRELDFESCYWQYGGAFPNVKDTVKSFAAYKKFADWCFENKYKRVSTYIANTNIVMLKMAFKVGFRIIGTRTFKGDILVELLNEKET